MKIYNIPIQAPEALATQFIDLICLSAGFQPPVSIDEITQEENPVLLTASELFQVKLNFVGNLAGKHLKEIAESKRIDLELQAKREELSQQNTQMSGLFTVLPVEIKENE